MSGKWLEKFPDDFNWRAVTPEDSPKTPEDVLSDLTMQRLGTPDVTEDGAAFDFERPLFDFSDGTERATGKTFRLLEAARSRPVALIFGSYT
ncbi:MAG: hypothetical protein OEU26_18150 [Candidatus Tectomicrobia bacterium]|nr:hypothetical protein [Candidatus Tectomicrobia bacterium]